MIWGLLLCVQVLCLCLHLTGSAPPRYREIYPDPSYSPLLMDVPISYSITCVMSLVTNGALRLALWNEGRKLNLNLSVANASSGENCEEKKSSKREMVRWKEHIQCRKKIKFDPFQVFIFLGTLLIMGLSSVMFVYQVSNSKFIKYS